MEKDLAKESRSFYNRIKSIAKDSRFVSDRCSLQFKALPVFANQRCGVWYVDPKLKNYKGDVYFKSTDGHFGQWKFNARRNNFHILPHLKASGGCVIVDSTRNGKSLPDSFSKTIPIWCAVINAALVELKKVEEKDAGLFVPHSVVSESETSQIRQRLPELLEQLRSYPALWKQLKELDWPERKPLRPLFLTPLSCPQFPWQSGFELDFYPVILLSASEPVADGLLRQHEASSSWLYVQGAADDHELWSEGLDPSSYWANIEAFNNLKLGSNSLAKFSVSGRETRFARVAESDLFVGCFDDQFVQDLKLGEKDWCVLCSEAVLDFERIANRNVIVVPVGCHKKFRWQLRRSLPDVCAQLQELVGSGKLERLYVLDNGGGTDAAVAVALAILYQFPEKFDLPQGVTLEQRGVHFKQRLQNILFIVQSSIPLANPNRSFLNSVHDFVSK